MTRETLASALSMIDERHVAYVTDRETGKAYTPRENGTASYIVGTTADTVKNVISVAACVVVAVAAVIAFILMRQSITPPPADTTTDAETGTETAAPHESETETETDTETETETDEPEENLIVAPEGYQVVWRCTSVVLVSAADGSKMTTRENQYDENGRLNTVTEYVRGFMEETRIHEYIYENGELIRMDTFRNGELASVRDFADGKLIKSSSTAYTDYTEYSYNEKGLLKRKYSYSREYSGESPEISYIDYEYDSNGNLTSEISYFISEFDYHYEYSYDENNNVTEMRYYDEDGVMYSNIVYEYNNGKCVSRKEYNRGALEDEHRYFYDSHGDLIRLDMVGSNDDGTDYKDSYIYEYVYDEKGQLLSETSVYDGRYTTKAYVYDSYGNIVLKSEPAPQYIFTYEPFIVTDDEAEDLYSTDDLLREHDLWAPTTTEDILIAYY